MLREVLDLDDLDAVDLITHDQSVTCELGQAGVDVQTITRKEVKANLLGTVQQAPFAVGQRPQASEEHADPDVALDQLNVREETGFDVA